jgi:hypothetical protein
MRVDPVRLDPQPGAAVVGAGRVMVSLERVQAAVWAVRHHREAAMEEPGSRINPLRAEVVALLEAEEEERVPRQTTSPQVEWAAWVR